MSADSEPNDMRFSGSNLWSIHEDRAPVGLPGKFKAAGHSLDALYAQPAPKGALTEIIDELLDRAFECCPLPFGETFIAVQE